jgi:hypothetical protein
LDGDETGRSQGQAESIVDWSGRTSWWHRFQTSVLQLNLIVVKVDVGVRSQNVWRIPDTRRAKPEVERLPVVRDLDAQNWDDPECTCMNGAYPLGSSRGSFKTGHVRGRDVLQIWRSETFDSVWRSKQAHPEVRQAAGANCKDKVTDAGESRAPKVNSYVGLARGELDPKRPRRATVKKLRMPPYYEDGKRHTMQTHNGLCNGPLLAL